VSVTLYSWLMIGLLAGFLAAIVALGLLSPRSGADVLGWRTGGTRDEEAAPEADDAAQMLAASNALRRRRGVPERAHADVAAAVRADRRALEARHPADDPDA
jgi:hypothetical protein